MDGYSINNRGAGLADMVTAIQGKRPHRANGEMAYHVLDAMEAFHDASATKGIVLESQCDQPAAVVANTM